MTNFEIVAGILRTRNFSIPVSEIRLIKIDSKKQDRSIHWFGVAIFWGVSLLFLRVMFVEGWHNVLWVVVFAAVGFWMYEVTKKGANVFSLILQSANGESHCVVSDVDRVMIEGYRNALDGALAKAGWHSNGA